MAEGALGNKYVIEGELAHGGMGHIYIATDRQLHRRVAIKRMRPEHVASPALRGRFEQEAMAVARLRNPHIVQIYDYGVEGDTPYLVMELLEGEDLSARLRRQKRLSLPQATALITQIAKGLASAHANGLVHRDLKPSNLFLARTDVGEVLKILDFGLAASAEVTEPLQPEPSSTISGTPPYMSPEQIQRRPLDHRTDLWSLGVIAYQMLTDSLPFEANALGTLALRITSAPAPPPSTLQRELGPEVDRFFDRALAKEPGQRFQSAREMAITFARLADTEPDRRPARILVIDDEVDTGTLLRLSFRRQIQDGVFQFLFASNGEEGLEHLRQHPDIDVVLTDINMPGMNGLTFLARASEEHPLVRVVIMSAYGDLRNIRTAMNRGAFDFLIKPIDFQDLEATVMKTVKHVRDVRRQLRSIQENSILRMFVHGGVVEQLMPMLRTANAVASELDSATIVFITLSGFDPIVRSAMPEVVVDRLNAHLEVLVPELLARGGIVDKFISHAVMVLFRGPDHGSRAIEACLAIRERLRQLGQSHPEGTPPWHGVAIGADVGEVVLGGIGSQASGRLDYTVLGEAVYGAGRLAALAQEHQICVGPALRAQLADAFEFNSLGERILPGATAAIPVFEVLPRRPLDTNRAPVSTTAVSSIDETSSPSASPSVDSALWLSKP